MKMAATVLLLIVATCPTAFAFRSGPPPGVTGSIASGGISCMACHGNAAGAGSAVILGLPSEYELDVVYDLTVRVADPDQLGAGFEISVEDAVGTHTGTLVLSDAVRTRFAGGNPGFVSHTLTGVADAVASWGALGNAAEYQVQWRSPAADAGAITFWLAGNAINNSFFNDGDTIYLTNTTILAATGGSCPGDLDKDGSVALSDLAIQLSNFGTPSGATADDGDFDGDGDVDLSDLAQMLSVFGTICP